MNFVSRLSGEGDRGEPRWRMRTYERGVEGETLACGTGAVAVASALWTLGLVRQLPLAIQTASGRVLEVGGEPDSGGSLKNVSLRGEGRIVFKAALFSL